MGPLDTAHTTQETFTQDGSQHGPLLGQGQIVSVQRTAVTSGSPADPSYECVFTVAVALDGVARYVATCRQSVPARRLASLMSVGTRVAIRVNPRDRSRIELSLGEAAPTA